ncbi:RDD family protein [Streptomyces iconiensis]|uniref:RDD family protein n=1 Tax=Streptomyces iconiensis TaxID=1384038 RepID=A0ABT6ZXU8_9ACTN|nr:RDD family protein [Streptomyces iconiensis]MDJ1133228.1 RDD family protein [Streptomyces iconiensis]
MSTEQPENDPFRKPEQPQPGASSGPPPGGAPAGQPPGAYGNPPPPPPPPPSADPYGTGGGGPYGAPGPVNPAADPLAGMPPLASRGKRLLARIIDALIVGIPVGLVVGLAEGGYSTNSGQTYWQQAVYTLVYLIYEGLMLTTSGQTLGKKLMRIRVGMLQNGAVPAGPPGWFRAATYSLPALVPCIGFLFWLVNVLFCTWDQPYHQCVHDKAARTVVVAAD